MQIGLAGPFLSWSRFKRLKRRRSNVNLRLLTTVLGALCVPVGFSGGELLAQQEIPLSLTTAREMARDANPYLIQAQNEAEANRGFERQAGALLNPTFSYVREQTTLSAGTNWENIFELNQPIEISGARGARKSLARSRREAAEALVKLAEWEIDFRVGSAYAQVLAAEYRSQETRDAVAIFDRAKEVAAVRLEQGDISGYEYRRIALEAARYISLDASLESERNYARLQLAQLIAPSADSVQVIASAMILSDLEFPDEVDLPLDTLVEMALNQRRDLVAQEHEVAARVSELRLRRREALPNPEVGFGFKNESSAGDTGSGFTFRIGLQVPLWNRSGGEVRAQSALVLVAESEREQLRRSVEGEVRQAWSALRAAQRQVVALEDLLGEDARIGLQAAEAAYAEGEISLVEWLDAVRAYHEAQLNFSDLVAGRAVRFMDLQRAVGVDLFGEIER